MLVAGATPETRGRPVHKLICVLHIEYILRCNITALHETARHPLAVERVAFDPDEVRVRDRDCDFGHRLLHKRAFSAWIIGAYLQSIN